MIWAVLTGMPSLKILSYFQHGNFGGEAMFGTVLFMPVFMLPMVLLKVPYKKVMNIYAPLQSLTFTIGKVNCLLAGCCMGKYLPSLGFQFPSQIADMVVGMTVTAVLLRIEHKNMEAHLYPRLMVIFGIARFAVDWFRYVPKPWKWGLPPTIIFSLISIMIGLVWLIILKRKQNNAEQLQGIE